MLKCLIYKLALIQRSTFCVVQKPRKNLFEVKFANVIHSLLILLVSNFTYPEYKNSYIQQNVEIIPKCVAKKQDKY